MNLGSEGSRFGFDGQTLKNCPFFAILYSKVRGSVRFLGGSEVRSSVLEDEFRFGRFKVRFSDGSGSSRFAIFRFVPTLLRSLLLSS